MTKAPPEVLKLTLPDDPTLFAIDAWKNELRLLSINRLRNCSCWPPSPRSPAPSGAHISGFCQVTPQPRTPGRRR